MSCTMEVVTKVESVTDESAVDPKYDSNNSSDPIVVRLTPTGKVSHAKTRVYTQRYRKEWEQTPDFKDWLTSVPYEATRAFCKFCQRNLHAHRLSLLKHMCTMKHQKAAREYDSGQIKQEQPEPKYIIERYDDDDDELSYEEKESYVQEGEEEVSIEYGEQEEVEQSEDETEIPVKKKTTLTKEEGQDTLAKAIANVHSDFLTENDESIQLEMVIESDHDNNDNSEETYEIVNCRTLSNDVKETTSQKNQNSDEETRKRKLSDENVKYISATEPKNFLETPKKIYLISTDGKKCTLVNSSFRQILLNQAQNKLVKNDTKNKIVSEVPSPNVPSTSQVSPNKNIVIVSPPSATKSLLIKKPVVSTNVLETSKGVPVCGLQVSLYKLQEGRWTFIHEAFTTANGHCNDFPNLNNNSAGRYKLHYDVEKYYALRKTATIYPFIEIVFDIKDPNISHNIPLLLSPYSYSTYRDSHK